MKKLIYLSLIAIVFLSSCSTSRNGVIMKRKYTKGYFVDIKNDKHKLKYTDVAAKTKQTKSESKSLEVEVLKELPTEEQENALLAGADNSVKVLAQMPKSTAPSVASNNVSVYTNVEKNDYSNVVFSKKTNKKKNRANASGADADVHLIILIILCLFPILALVAIYLKDGKSITMNFWIDLILHFLLLYWLFALLVILDVINFA